VIRWLDLHLLYLLLPLSVLAGATAYFGSAPGLYLGIGLFALAQFLILTKAVDRSRQGGRLAFVLLNEIVAVLLIIALVVLPWLFRG